MTSFYYNNLQDYAMHKCAYYICFKCQKPYFGGLKDCGDGFKVEEEEKKREEEEKREFKPEELVCPGCSAISIGAGQTKCEKHGSEFIDFKCKFCCSLAMWFCWGTTHFCDPCHMKAGSNVVKVCKGPGQCDLGKLLENHPPNGSEYALGCNVCRSNSLS